MNSTSREIRRLNIKSFFNRRGIWRCYRCCLRWLNRVMQDHEARASDLNRKLIFSFFFAIFLIKATET